MMGMPVAFAEGDESVLDEPAAQVDCFGGKEQFGSFLRSFISFDQFDFFVKDMFMNACQYTATKLVKDDLKDLREDIRDSYYQCNDNQASNLRIDYNRKEAELFFIRNVVVTNGNTRVKGDLGVLRQKMFDKFVKKKKYFLEKPEEGAKQEVFADVWSDFVEDYDPQYFVDCKNDVQAIQDGIDGIRDTIEGITQEFRDTQGEFEELVQESEATGNKTAPKEQLKLNAMNIFAQSINNVSPQKFGQDLIRELGDEGRRPTQFELTQRLAREERRYRMDLKRAQKFAYYKAKYQTTSDPISLDYRERVDLLVETLESAQIETTSVKGCLEFVNETQCSG